MLKIRDMKKPFFLLTLSLFIGVFTSFSGLVHAQGVASFRVIDMIGFPHFPPDSAYEGQVYTFNVRLINNSNAIINTPAEIQLKVDSVETTIYTDPQPSIQPGDTVTVTVTGYNFQQTQYVAGNNIVVVWPRVSNQPVVPVDTFYTAVYFVPLISLNEFEQDPDQFDFYVFPVPAKDFIQLRINQPVDVEYVRIFTISGKLCGTYNPVLPETKIPVNQLYPGRYVIELKTRKGRYQAGFVKSD